MDIKKLKKLMKKMPSETMLKGKKHNPPKDWPTLEEVQARAKKRDDIIFALCNEKGITVVHHKLTKHKKYDCGDIKGLPEFK